VENPMIVFGTDGYRGLLGTDLNHKNIERVAQAFAAYITQKGKTKKVAIGYDGRTQSDTFAMTFAEILSGNGIEVLLSDAIIPTPVVSFTCRSANCDAGVMITASHNPPEYNGLKFKTAQGSPFPTEETALVEALLDKQNPVKSSKNITKTSLLLPYLEKTERLIDFTAIRQARLCVAIDSMAGAGQNILEKLLLKHGINAKTIYSQATPNFSGRLAEPIEANLTPLAQLLTHYNFSMGVATDGDGDRLGVLTDSGKWMNIQECILYLTQYYLTERKIKGPVVKTASVTGKLENIAKIHNTEVIDVPVGFKYVAEAMMQHHAAFGAEESGGFGFKEHIPDRDGIFSALIFLEMMAKAGYNSLDEFLKAKRSTHGNIHYERIDISNQDPGRYHVLPKLSETPPKHIDIFKVLETTAFKNSRGLINGIKFFIEGNPRWLLIRVSETEPIIRIYAEGETPSEIKNLLAAGKNLFYADCK
jgi:phosphomannomutase